jgi:hypothetical protein
MTNMPSPTLLPTLRGLPLSRFLAACLLVAALCQWLAAGAVAEAGNLGMGAPLPPAWEASRPGAASGQPSGWRVDSDFERAPPQAILGGPRWFAPALPPVDAVDRRDSLLRWGRLLLEGG